MYGHRCRCFFRSRRSLIFTGVVVVLFLMHQLLSVKQLNKELSNRRPKLQKNFRSYEKAEAPIQFEKREVFEETKQMLGVPANKQKFYVPSSRNTFLCLTNGEEISFSAVNDNFCDCADFSDEPSTSACNFGQFYCTQQSDKSQRSIVSYKVNDGVCDCCDGSDEWQYKFLPPHVIVPANKQKGIFQVPCPNRCTS